MQASYLLAQAKLDDNNKKWLELIDKASQDAARINREIREILARAELELTSNGGGGSASAGTSSYAAGIEWLARVATQEVLGAVKAFHRSHVDVSSRPHDVRAPAARVDIGIQQRSQVLILTMACFPQQLETRETPALSP